MNQLAGLLAQNKDTYSWIGVECQKR
jgi:hypothetical protein